MKDLGYQDSELQEKGGGKKALGHIINLSLNMEWRHEYALAIFLSKIHTPTLPRANSCFQILKKKKTQT